MHPSHTQGCPKQHIWASNKQQRQVKVEGREKQFEEATNDWSRDISCRASSIALSQAGLVKVLHAAVHLHRLVTLHTRTLPQEALSSSPLCPSSSSSSPTSIQSSGRRRLRGWSSWAMMRRNPLLHIVLLVLTQVLAAFGDPVLRSPQRSTSVSSYSFDLAGIGWVRATAWSRPTSMRTGSSLEDQTQQWTSEFC